MLLFFYLSAGLLHAADWQLRPGDQPFSADELQALPGQSLLFFDDGESFYGAGGAYAYTYGIENGSGTAWGTYRIAQDGSICVDFINGTMRCDLLVRSAGRVVVITETGDRFPVR
ncbi:hypothetical protein [Epibacterium ulvae]|uniref:hypothetical protein n=1 Tax=Epibacterium ulvae TaxID=1156985 RepID=UPI00248FDF16|nr:hypothetical protein [Epibacterium ulvae]